VNDVTDSRKQQAILLSTIGTQAYKILRNLIFPSAPTEKSLQAIGGDDQYWAITFKK